MAEATSGVERLDVVLVDRTEVRHDAFVSTPTIRPEAEPKPELESRAFSLQHARLTVDIADLRLDLLGQFRDSVRSAAVGKHLCGVATDLTLRCYTRAVIERSGVAYVALALCCHHLCQWEGFVDIGTLTRHGIGAGEFALMRRLATKYRAHPLRQRPPGAELPATHGAQLAAARATCGIMAKRCLNSVRAAWLQRQGWENVRLVRYVAEEQSPENVLLVGMRCTP